MLYIHLVIYIYIYEKSTVQLTSVGLTFTKSLEIMLHHIMLDILEDKINMEIGGREWEGCLLKVGILVSVASTSTPNISKQSWEQCYSLSVLLGRTRT